jgi:uncharacterized protein YgiM (DUF1202 family)
MRGARYLAAVVLSTSLVLGTLTIGYTPSTSAQEIQVGEPVVVTVDALNVRSEPTLSGSIVTVLRFTDVVRVVSAPTFADGYDWYQIQRADVTIGWAVRGFIPGSAGPPDQTPYWPTTPTTPTPSGGYVYGTAVTVTTSLLNVRALPSITAQILTVYPAGRVATITGEARVADNITWYPVDNYGWVSGEYLTAGGATTPTPGDEVINLTVTADVLNVRSSPDLSGTIVDVRYYGQLVRFYDRAYASDGSLWIAINAAETQWVSNSFVDLHPDPNAAPL